MISSNGRAISTRVDVVISSFLTMIFFAWYNGKAPMYISEHLSHLGIAIGLQCYHWIQLFIIQLFNCSLHCYISSRELISIAGHVPWIWVSGNDLGYESVWCWDGFTTEMIDPHSKGWLPHEPNNCCGGEHCMCVRKDGGWNDCHCHGARPFICEMRSYK